MRRPFESDKAGEQVARILEHVAFPGLAVLLDPDGLVVGGAGAAPGVSARDVATVFGAVEGWVLGAHGDRAAGLSASEHVTHAVAIGPYRLVVVMPRDVCVPHDRLRKASALLERMLARGRAFGPDGPVHAWVSDAPPRRRA